MRLRRRPSPLLLLLLPAFASIVVADPRDTSLQRERGDIHRDPVPTLPPSSPSRSKDEIGTKDAPVDGLDGKPHKGPFLVDNSDKKPALDVEDLSDDASSSSSSSSSSDPAIGPKKLIEEDGVMNDKHRDPPKYTGTEDGISEKARKAKEEESSGKMKKVPDPPKEGRKDDDASETARALGAVGLEKPTDLPDSPHDIPHPQPPSLSKDDSDDEGGYGRKHRDGEINWDDDEDENIIQPFHSFVLSVAMIVFSEIGDKTFLVAALMAMRHPRFLVFTAAFSALLIMTILSAVLGHTVPTLLPRRFTSFGAAILFLVFGIKMLREGLAMSPEDGVGEEMKEVEMELEEKEHLARSKGGRSRRRSSISPYVLESGRAGRRSRSMSRLPTPRSPSSSPSRSPSPAGSSLKGALHGLNNLFSLLLSPAWVQTFVMTFLGEWGDRSQIATIAMAAGADYWWVTGGAIIGHAACTTAAVLGGRAIAGRVSMRVVTLGGAIAFLLFAVLYLIEASYAE